MIKRLLLIVLLSLAGAWVLRSFFFETVAIATGSMEPTLPLGTRYGVNKWVYKLVPPRRGDIVMFKSPVEPGKGLIKRVVAVGGDRVEIRNKQVFLNGQPLYEPYAVHKRASERLVGDNLGPLTAPPDHVFVLGDDRDESEDSSVWKDPKTGTPVYFVKNSEIQGRLMRP